MLLQICTMLNCSVVNYTSSYSKLRRLARSVHPKVYNCGIIWDKSVHNNLPCNIAILGLSFAQYLIQPLFEKCQLPDESVRIIAAAAICILVLLNCWDVGASAKVTSVFTFSKLFALAVIITAGIFEIAKGNHDNFTESLFKYSKWDPGNITVAFFSGFFAYGGASTLNFVTEEIQNPSKTLPRAIFLSITTVIIAYVLANMAYFSVMSPQEILDSEAVAVSFGIRTLGSFSWVIPVFIVISTFGGLGVLIMQFSRLVFAGARSGHLPRVLSFVQIHRFTPAPALIFMGLISLIYLSTSDVYILITYGGFMYNFAGLGIASSIIYLRRVRPNLHRPIKVPLILPIISIIMSLCLVCLPIYTAPKEAAVGCGIMLTGLPVYYLLVLPSQNSNFIQSGLTNTISSATNVIQKLLVAVPEEMNFRSESNSLINRTN